MVRAGSGDRYVRRPDAPVRANATTADRTPPLAAAGNGDAAALEEVLTYVYEASPVWAAIGRVLFDATDADDAMQETLLAVASSLSKFDRRRPFLPWVTVIAHHKAVDIIRRRRDRVVATTNDSELFDATRSGASRFSSTLTTRMELEEAVAGLSPKLAEVVRLRDVEQLSYAEIANATGVGVNTVRSRLARGRAQAQHVLAHRSA